MQPTVRVIMLAGALRTPALRRQTGLPALCLPLATDVTLLTRWFDAFSSINVERDVHCVVRTEDDARLVRRHAESLARGRCEPVRVMTEPASWRGTAGIVEDVASNVADDGVIIVVEANTLAPDSLLPLVDSLDPHAQGVVGVCGEEPNGIYAFRRSVFRRVPVIGYFDLKEQLLPALHENGDRVRPAPFEFPVRRVRDRAGYLDAVRAVVESGRPGVSPLARIEPGARIAGACLIDPGAAVEAGAIVHDSVVLRGARIGADAVVSECVVSPNARVESGARIVRDVVAAEAIPLRAGASGAAAAPEVELRRRRA